MQMPRPSEATRTFFRQAVARLPGTTVRPMFGQEAAFIHDHMFAGIYGDDIMVRLPETGRAEVQKAGGVPFAPGGRPMKEYVVVPRTWASDAKRIRPWLEKACAYAGGLPPKKTAKVKAAQRRP